MPHCNRPATENLFRKCETQKMDDKLMSSINSLQIIMQMIPLCILRNRTTCSTHRCSNSTKHCGELVVQCIVDIICNEQLSVEYICGISDTYSSLPIVDNFHFRLNSMLLLHRFHCFSHLSSSLRPTNVFDRCTCCCRQFARYNLK